MIILAENFDFLHSLVHYILIVPQTIQLKKLMLALGFTAHGGLENMSIFQTHIPKIASHEVLIDVKASAFNHLDIWVREGWPGLKLSLPHISGSDAAGIITQVGSAVTGFAIGDRVSINPGINPIEDDYSRAGEYCVSPHFKILGEQLPGTHAQYLAVPANNCLKIPDNISFERAAAVGLVGVTTWRMLMTKAQLQSHHRVLILGAGGGVNSLSIQIAKSLGCKVFATTSSEEKVQCAVNLGADAVLNYATNQNWAKELFTLTNFEGFDVIVDNVGQATLPISLRLAKRGGKVVIVGNTSGHQATIDTRYLFTKQIQIIGSTMGNPKDYLDVMKWIYDNQISPSIYAQLPLQEGIKGMELLEHGKQFGKVILSQE